MFDSKSTSLNRHGKTPVIHTGTIAARKRNQGKTDSRMAHWNQSTNKQPAAKKAGAAKKTSDAWRGKRSVYSILNKFCFSRPALHAVYVANFTCQ